MLHFSKKYKQPSEEEFKDLGFGTQANRSARFLNADGSINVKRKGLPFFRSLNTYHSLITMSWMKFNLLILFLYVAVNLFFASLYVLFGTENLAGATGVTLPHQFFDAFFFSAQTFTTVGYGRISPVGIVSNILAAIESLAGLLAFALATGLLYGRFSRPLAKIIFSDKAIIAPYKGITAFEFKIANERRHELIEVEVEVILAFKASKNGNLRGGFEALPLERKKITFMPFTWTIVHPIDENSKLYGITPEELEESDAEFLVILKAFDDTFSQHIYSRSSYKYHDIVWGAKFTSVFNKVVDGITIVELDKIHIFEKAALPILQNEIGEQHLI